MRACPVFSGPGSFHNFIMNSLPSILKKDVASDQDIVHVCDACRPSIVWVWHEEEFNKDQLNQQKLAVQPIPKALEVLVEWYNLKRKDNTGHEAEKKAKEENIEDKDIDKEILKSMIYYSQQGYPWTEYISGEVRTMAHQCAQQILSSGILGTTDQVVRVLLDEVVGPAFSRPTHEWVSESGRKRTGKPKHKLTNLGFTSDQLGQQEDQKPWRTTDQGAIAVLEFCVSVASPTLIESVWPLIMPATLNIVDDVEQVIKAKGCELIEILVTRADAKFLQRTGCLDLMAEAVRPCLVYLPPSVKADISVVVVSKAISALRAIAETYDRISQPTSNGMEQTTTAFKRQREKIIHLRKLMNEGILPGMDQTADNVQLSLMYLQQITALVDSFQIEIIRYLPQLTKTFVTIMSDPFVGAVPDMPSRCCNMILQVMSYAWPRISNYRYDILLGLIKATKSLGELQDKGRESEESLRAIDMVVECLNDIVPVKQEWEQLLSLDTTNKT